MSRVLFLAASFVAAASAVDAQELERACTRGVLPETVQQLDLGALFSRVGESVETANGVSAPMGPLEVVLVRIGDDGKPVLDCVDNEHAARRFFAKPLMQLAPSVAEER